MKKLALITLLVVALGYAITSTVFKEEKADASRVADFTLASTTGEKIELNQQGSVILNFWATYCPPCEREMPAFEAAYTKLQQDGTAFYAINVEEPTKLVNQYLAKFELSFPILLDRDGAVKDHFEVVMLPTTIFIKDGKVVHTVNGELTEQQLLEFAKKIQ